MITYSRKLVLYTSIFCMGVTSCTEPFLIKTLELEKVLVVESTITNELKRQAVKLTRTIGLEDFGQEIEENAMVKIENGQGRTFNFEMDPTRGLYLSKDAFQVLPEMEYTLHIVTQDGQSYTSSAVTLPPEVQMDYPELSTETGQEGIEIKVDSEPIKSQARYFRYEYEETYEARLPHPSPFTAEIVGFDNFTRTFRIELKPRRLDLACYTTIQSSGILQTSTLQLGEQRINRLPIRFIEKGNPIIRDRYSILVRQFVQSLEAYTFYQTLADLGNQESLLSQGQPGFVNGNIVAENNNNQTVMGFFEASSVSSQRIFLDHQDFGIEKPPYFVECDHLISYMITSALLKRKLEFENYQVFFFEEKSINGSAPKPIYHISQSICSECRPSSTHEKPEYWE